VYEYILAFCNKHSIYSRPPPRACWRCTCCRTAAPSWASTPASTQDAHAS